MLKFLLTKGIEGVYVSLQIPRELLKKFLYSSNTISESFLKEVFSTFVLKEALSILFNSSLSPDFKNRKDNTNAPAS